ncbi:MAG: helix-turn-helix domain-containing protein [Verrucomicrobia bacterium]|nr:helix-turn-helix domain-containing protein [Verrucomicrobiota bacterium]
MCRTRVPYCRVVYINRRGELFFTTPGCLQARFTRLFAPKPERCRAMLEEIRKELGLSTDALAALLGVPSITLRRWENGQRNFCAAAKRLLWLLHCQLFEPRLPYKAGAWLWWEEAKPKSPRSLHAEPAARQWEAATSGAVPAVGANA